MAATDLVDASTRVSIVSPPHARVQVGVADLRAVPDDDAELVDQAHNMEELRVLGERGDWRFVQGEDQYLGWIRADQIRVWPHFQAGVVGVLLADVHERPSEHSPVIERLPAGTRAAGMFQAPVSKIRPADPAWMEIPFDVGLPSGSVAPSASRIGFLSLAALVGDGEIPIRYPTAADYLKTAESFIGIPYLWGGTTALGLDCSGLVQQVYRLNGVALPRDADQQAMLGRRVEKARAGDLMFFGAEAITHVALATSESEFIHAPMKGGIVERGRLGGDRILRGIRRYLPDVSNA